MRKISTDVAYRKPSSVYGSAICDDCNVYHQRGTGYRMSQWNAWFDMSISALGLRFLQNYHEVVVDT